MHHICPHWYREAKQKALHLLNYKLPQYPPDVFYIRRNPDMVKKYLNPNEYNTLIERAQPPLKYSYHLFALSPKDINYKESIRNF